MQTTLLLSLRPVIILIGWPARSRLGLHRLVPIHAATDWRGVYQRHMLTVAPNTIMLEDLKRTRSIPGTILAVARAFICLVALGPCVASNTLDPRFYFV